MSFIGLVLLIWFIMIIATREFDFEYLFIAVFIAMILSGVLDSPRVN